MILLLCKCFEDNNYLIDNKDDQAKNFALIYRDGDWHFVPAYNLFPSDGINGF